MFVAIGLLLLLTGFLHNALSVFWPHAFKISNSHPPLCWAIQLAVFPHHGSVIDMHVRYNYKPAKSTDELN